MKKLIILASIAVIGAAFTGCNDFLDDHRYPLTQQTDSPAFWDNESNVAQEANLLLNTIPGYGAYGANVTSSGSTTMGDFYFKAFSDDQIGMDGGQQQWKYVNVPQSSSDYNGPYINIRQCMILMDNVAKSNLREDIKNNYIGIARLFRAMEAFKLVQRYGDIIWVDEVVDLDSPVLYGARQNRDEVMDKVLEDLNFACNHISTQSNTLGFSKDMANAAKAEITLWEGTFCKYRTEAENGQKPDLERSTKWLNECVAACQTLMDGRYTLAADYDDIYKSASIGGFTSVPEIILGKAYGKDVLGHSVIAYTSTGTVISGLTKDAFDSFLFLDGKPLGLQPQAVQDEAGQMVTLEDGTTAYSIENLLAVRDKRLSKITDPFAYCQGMSWCRHGSDPMASTTGYGVRKFDNWVDLELYYRRTIGQNYTCAPIYWLSAIYCTFAEAKAELGNISQTDLDNSINKLYARAGLPALSLAGLFHDPANTIGVSDIIWETRRCRRCELMLDKDYRYWDLIRWHQLEKMANNPADPKEAFLGANMANAVVYTDPDLRATLSFKGTYLNGCTVNREWNSKHYLYPIPADQAQLNPNLRTNNPGW